MANKAILNNSQLELFYIIRFPTFVSFETEQMGTVNVCRGSVTIVTFIMNNSNRQTYTDITALYDNRECLRGNK